MPTPGGYEGSGFTPANAVTFRANTSPAVPSRPAIDSQPSRLPTPSPALPQLTRRETPRALPLANNDTAPSRHSTPAPRDSTPSPKTIPETTSSPQPKSTETTLPETNGKKILKPSGDIVFPVDLERERQISIDKYKTFLLKNQPFPLMAHGVDDEGTTHPYAYGFDPNGNTADMGIDNRWMRVNQEPKQSRIKKNCELFEVQRELIPLAPTRIIRAGTADTVALTDPKSAIDKYNLQHRAEHELTLEEQLKVPTYPFNQATANGLPPGTIFMYWGDKIQDPNKLPPIITKDVLQALPQAYSWRFANVSVPEFKGDNGKKYDKSAFHHEVQAAFERTPIRIQ